MIQADALALPLASASVDLIVTSPPYPQSGVWDGDYWACLDQAKAEMRRVLKPGRVALIDQRRLRDFWWVLEADREWSFGPSHHVEPPEGYDWWVADEGDVRDLIWCWSQPGELVVDPFAGTGVVERVAESEGRMGISLDIVTTDTGHPLTESCRCD